MANLTTGTMFSGQNERLHEYVIYYLLQKGDDKDVVRIMLVKIPDFFN